MCLLKTRLFCKICPKKILKEENALKILRCSECIFYKKLFLNIISTYESGYEFKEGGKGEIEVNFKDNKRILRHTEVSRRSDTIPLFEIDL